MLKKFAIGILYDHLHDLILRNLTLIKDDMRYHNWYHGYTSITLPSREQYFGKAYENFYAINTCSSSGSISSQHFGKEFDAANVKVVSYIQYIIIIFPPEYVRENYDVTLHVQIDKASIEEGGYEKMYFRSLLNTNEHKLALL